MKLVYITCDICNKGFNEGNLIYNDLYLCSNTFKSLEGHINGQVLNDIDFITTEYMNDMDICPECLLKISKCIELIEKNNRGDVNVSNESSKRIFN